MVRALTEERRSVALSALAIFWGTLGGLSLLGLVLQIVAPSGDQSSASGVAVVGRVLGGLLIALICFVIARGLWRRSRAAYIANVVVLGIALVGGVCALASGAVVVGSLLGNEANRDNEITAGIGVATLVLMGVVAVSLIVPLVMAVLTALSYGNVFGRMTRITPEVRPGDVAAGTTTSDKPTA
jgi:hypothetical protein